MDNQNKAVTGEGNAPRVNEILEEINQCNIAADNAAANGYAASSMHSVIRATELRSQLIETAKRAEAERDELLAALKIVAADTHARFGVDKTTNTPISEVIRSAIAKAEGSK